MTYPHKPKGREAVYLTGEALAALTKELADHPAEYSLRVSGEGDVVRFKVDEGMWSPPYKQEADPKRTH